MGYFDKDVWDYVSYDAKDKFEELSDYTYMEKVNQLTSKYAPQLGEETFYGLYDPIVELDTDVPDALKPERALLEKAVQTDGWAQLRENVSGDALAAMMGLSTFCREIIANLPEDVKDNLEKNQQAQQQQEQAQQNAERAANDPNATAQQKASAQQALLQARQQAQQALQQAMNSLGKSGAQLEAAAYHAIRETDRDMKETSEQMQALGCGNGRKPLTKKDIETAEKMKDMFKKNKRLRHLVDLVGSMKRVVSNEKKLSPFGRENIVSYKRAEIDIDTIVPTELLGLCCAKDSPMKKLFLTKAADNALMHYEYEGEAESGKGPMILLKDTSGSMYGDRFELATALEIAIVQQMVREHRRCITIPFSGRGDYELFEVKENPNFLEILENASVNYGGGTEPYTPLEKAMDVILENQNFKRAGILIITDGEFFEPPQPFLDKLEEAKKNPGIYISAICLGSSAYFGENSGIRKFANTVVNIGDLYSSFENDEDIGKALKNLI